MTKHSEEALRAVIEADPARLSTLQLQLEAESFPGAYARVLHAYWKNDLIQLETLAKSNGDTLPSAEQECLRFLTQLRVAIRKLASTTQDDLEKSAMSGVMQAEISFVRAMYFEIQNEEAKANEAYLEAQRLFFQNDCLKKAAKAFFNSVACRSRMFPEQRQMLLFQEAAQLAKSAGDGPTEGAALNGISREFHLMRALRVALQYATQAVSILRECAYGSYNFYMALCHRCQVNLELGYVAAAQVDLEEASASTLPEIKQSLAVIHEWMAKKNLSLEIKTPELDANVSHVPYTWQERKDNGLNESLFLSDLEAILVKALFEGPKDRFELTSILWGEKEDFFSLENRLKQLVHRLRRKDSGIVGFAEGKYFLLDSEQSRWLDAMKRIGS